MQMSCNENDFVKKEYLQVKIWVILCNHNVSVQCKLTFCYQFSHFLKWIFSFFVFTHALESLFLQQYHRVTPIFVYVFQHFNLVAVFFFLLRLLVCLMSLLQIFHLKVFKMCKWNIINSKEKHNCLSHNVVTSDVDCNIWTAFC